MTQERLGEKMSYSRQQISKMVYEPSDKRPIKVEDLITILETLDDQVLYLQAIYFITSGIYGVEDIKRDEKHPASQYFAFNKSIQNVLDALRRYPLIDNKIDKKNVTEVLDTLIELSRVTMKFIATISEFYNISTLNHIKTKKS